MITKLTSNYNDNFLVGVGGAKIQNNLIKITAESGTGITLLRDVNKIVLCEAKDQRQKVKGKFLLGDVYLLENGDKKLTIKVEEETKHEENIYVNPDPIYDATSQKRKTTLTAGVLILILLIFSVVFGINQKNKREFNKVSESILNQALIDYEKSSSEEDIDKVSSRELFISAKESAFKLKEDGYKSDALDKLVSDITLKEAEVLGEIRTEVKELLDLTLQINGFSGDQIASTGEVMFILDKQNKSVIQVDINGKGAKIIAGKDSLNDVSQISSYEEKLFSIKNDGIHELTNKKEKVSDENAYLFYLYSGNIYLIKKDENEIFRLTGGNGGFSEKQGWLAPGIEADFSKVIDMSIDGSIWLLSSSGKVTKFTNGNPQNIQMKGMIENLTNPTAIYTNEKLKNVYILDKEKGRVVVLEKNGDFKMQYISDGIKEAKDLVVSEEEGKIILLTGSKLMYFEPK